MEAGVQRKVLRVALGGKEGRVGIPYFILQGRKPGPTVFFAAGEHGIELNGVAAVHQFVEGFDPGACRGTIVAVPIVAPSNVQYRHHTKDQPRGEPYTFDMPYNTYLRWPGRPDGEPADRICHAIASRLLSGVSAVVNFHAWGWYAASAAAPGGNPATRDEIPLGKTLGVPFFLYGTKPSDYPPGQDRLAAYASYALGVPGYLVELRMQWMILPSSCECGMRVMRNVCRYFGMMRGRMEPNPGGQFNLADFREVALHAPRAGLYVPVRPIETRVRKGAVLGYLYGDQTGRTTPITSPVNGYLWLNHRAGRKADVRLEDQHAYADKGDLLALVKYAGRRAGNAGRRATR